MWSMKISKRLVITCGCMRTLCLVLLVVWYQATMLFLLRPGGHCSFQLPSNGISEHSFLFSFSCPFWFWRKTISLTQWILFLFLCSLLLFIIPSTSIPPRLAVFYPALLCLSTKGPVMPLDQGRLVIIFNRYISPRGWPPVPFLFLSDPFVVLSDAPNLTQAPAGNLMSL